MKNISMKQIGGLLVGAFLFSFGMNAFIAPLNLFSSGIVGFSQLIRAGIMEYTTIGLPTNIDVAGIINLLLNIPLLYIAYKYISKPFFIKTLFCITIETILLTLLTFPKPLIDDVLASVLIGGVICGFGVGLILRAGGSGGGLDIIGMLLVKKKKAAGVGRIGIYINAVIIVLSAMMFDLQTALYTGLYCVVMSLVLDRTHYQNIKTSAMIFTKRDDIPQVIFKELGRGVTMWKGMGAYTKEDTNVLMVVLSKYEISKLNVIMTKHDPNAFVIINEGMSVFGNYEQRL